jgi:regulator of PEP synthase PpsR (kinase-PPPase family)
VTPGEQFRRLLEQQASQSCIVPGIGLPHQLEHLKKPLVVSLHATPERLIQVRQNRLLSMGEGPSSDRQR